MINLEKKGKSTSINLSKDSQKITASLRWDTQADLDLYGFYVTRDGVEGKVYYKNLGSLDMAPHLQLDGDSRDAGCETINLGDPSSLKYLLIAAYSAVENGVGSFKSYNARAVVSDGQGQEVSSSLSEENDRAYWVAIALIDFSDLNNVKVTNVETYSGDNVENSPVLHKDGTFEMDVGPIEFKTMQDTSGCFIATACFDSRADEEVIFLRWYRDNVLLNSTMGENFVRSYYRFSPPVAEWIHDKPLVKRPMRALIKLVVKILK